MVKDSKYENASHSQWDRFLQVCSMVTEGCSVITIKQGPCVNAPT